MSAPPSKTPKPCEVRRTNPNIMLQNTSARKPTIVARSLLPIRLTRPLPSPIGSSNCPMVQERRRNGSRQSPKEGNSARRWAMGWARELRGGRDGRDGRGPSEGRRRVTPLAQRELPTSAGVLVSARFSRRTRNRRYDPPTRRQQSHGRRERCSSWQTPQREAQ